MMAAEITCPPGRGVLATLVHTEGGAPRRPGAQMWVDSTGTILGSVTIGGCVDVRVIELTANVLESMRPMVVAIPLGDDDAWALGMTCAGTVRVLLEPVDENPAHPVRASAAFSQRQRALGVRSATLICTDTGQRFSYAEDGTTEGAFATAGERDDAIGHLRAWIEAGRPAAVTEASLGGQVREVYVDVTVSVLELVVFGASHVAVPLVEFASLLGWRTIVVDARDRYATEERFPRASQRIVGMPSDVASRLVLGPRSAVVLLSHDYKYDLPVLRAILNSAAAYVGCMGSRKRGAAMLEFLRDQGVSEAALARVHIPIGLNVGAQSAEEIALSIASEVLAVLRGRDGNTLRAPRIVT